MRWLPFWLACALFAQAEDDLDPSIFDGSGEPKPLEHTRQPIATSNAGGEQAQSGVSEGEGRPDGETSASAQQPAGGDAEGKETTQAEAGQAEPAEAEESGAPAAGGGQPGRAGETFIPTERIPPDQAVDLPWDI